MKRIRNILGFVFVLTAAMSVAACTDPMTSESSGSSSEVTAEKAQVLIAGQTADENGAYAITLEEEESKSFTLVVGTLTDYVFEVVTSESTVVSVAVTSTTLTLEGLDAGSAVVTLSEKSEKAENVTVNVTVTEKEVEEKPTPTGINVTGTSGGVGEISDPYTVEFSSNKNSTHNLVVRPSDADIDFTWTVGTIADGAFTATEDTKLTVAQEGTTLNFVAQEAGVYAVEGASKSGGFKVYFNVTVNEYFALTGIQTTDLAVSDEAEYDYYFKTAKGTGWNMVSGNAGRADAVAGGGVVSGYQIPLNQTYFASLYKINFTPVPAEATDSVWAMSYSTEGVFTLLADGSWSADEAGTTVVTVSNTSGEASVKILVEVVDTLYNGVLKSEFDAAETDTEMYWNFDSNPDDYAYTKAMLEDWHLVMNKTTGDPNGADGNQKMFYLGTPDRVYGICLESRIDSATGLGAGAVTSLAWAKTHISKTATTLTAFIGNNDKTFGSYRIMLVKADGTAYCITNGWIEKTKANDDGKPFVEYTIPDACKDADVAIVVESSLGAVDNNFELHIKGIWINQYKGVESVQLSEAAATVGQGGAYGIKANALPSDASYKTLTYAVTTTPEGGEGAISVDANGKISVAVDAKTGEYTVTVTSTDNAAATATFTLTVIEYTPLTAFNGTLSLAGREINYGAEGLDGAKINATYDANGVYTDSALSLTFSWNENASVTDYDISFSAENVVSISGNQLKFIGVGSTDVTITPKDNTDLAIIFTVNVAEYTADSLLAGTKITATSVAMLGADSSAVWNNAAGMKKFLYNTVDRRHGNAKWNYEGNVIQFESHTVEANYQSAVNVGYGVVALATDATNLNFEVRGHNDDRYLESANVRVRVAYLDGETCKVDTLLDWTTVASRWKQQQEWYKLSVDVSTYAGKNVVVIFESAGGLQNNGNFPKGSDSSAGAYLYLGKISVTNALPEGSTVAVNGEIFTDSLTRMYANAFVKADGWTVSAAGKGGDGYGSYTNSVYSPLSLTYTGSLSELVTLSLTTSTFYSNQTKSALYPWGVFPALNNSESGSIELSSSDESIFKVVDGVITPVANGNANLLVKARAIGSETEFVTFKVAVNIQAVSLDVQANAASAEIEADSSYQLDFFTVPAAQNVTFKVVSAPEGAAEGSYSVDNNGLFTAEKTASLGKYVVRIAIAEDESVYCDVEITVKTVSVWDGKAAILDANTGWKLNEGGSYDAGVGEGADLNKGGSYWYNQITVSDLSVLSVSARIFARGGETNPVIYVSVVDGETETRLGVNGTSETTVTIETDPAKGGSDATQTFVYLLKAYVGKTVEVRIGIDQGTHCVFQKFAFSAPDVSAWNNKNAILNADNGWKLNEGGSYDAGVGEGADLNKGGSYWYRSVSLYDLTSLTVNARVFVRGGETNPVMYVSVVVDGVETRIKANGETADTVTLDTTDAKYDTPNAWVYDLSAYVGKTVEIRIGIDQGTHCVITGISLT